jgi:hypothetical protein
MNRLRLLKFANQLRRAGSINAHAVAFILTEMRFPGPLVRTCEILYALWSIYLLRREPRLTLGKCQVSFSYWRQRYGKDNLALFRAVLDDFANYQICCDYLQINQRSNLRETIICYNGRPSVLYVRLFYEHLDLFNSIVQFCPPARSDRSLLSGDGCQATPETTRRSP